MLAPSEKAEIGMGAPTTTGAEHCPRVPWRKGNYWFEVPLRTRQ